MKYAFAHQSMLGDPAFMNDFQKKDLDDMIRFFTVYIF